ncbi:MAG: class I SAM-dependent methyltransferase [Ignavibacteriales bacterium]|nr:class I SAM-dependent methyltransferase [Ignavibacteriales bacterium]
MLSLGLHFLWKRATVRRLGLGPGDEVLDVCGGTADLALLAAKRIGPSGPAVVCDFNRPMMEAGRAKAARAAPGRHRRLRPGRRRAPAVLRMPRSTRSTVGFGLRNLVDPDRGLGEIRRVLKPGGRLAILEFSLPRRRWQRSLYAFYSFRHHGPGRAAHHRDGRTVPLPRRIHPGLRAARGRGRPSRPGRIRRRRLPAPLSRYRRRLFRAQAPGGRPCRRSTLTSWPRRPNAGITPCARSTISATGSARRARRSISSRITPRDAWTSTGAWPKAGSRSRKRCWKRPTRARSAASATPSAISSPGMRPTAVMRALKDYVEDYRREGRRGRPARRGRGPAEAAGDRRPGLGVERPGRPLDLCRRPLPAGRPADAALRRPPGLARRGRGGRPPGQRPRPALRHPGQRRQRLRLRLHGRHRPRHEPDAQDRVRPRQLVRPPSKPGVTSFELQQEARRRGLRDQRRRTGGHGLRQHRLHGHVLDLVQRLRHGRGQLRRHGVRRPRRPRLPAQRQAGPEPFRLRTRGRCPPPASAPRPSSSSTPRPTTRRGFSCRSKASTRPSASPASSARGGSAWPWPSSAPITSPRSCRPTRVWPASSRPPSRTRWVSKLHGLRGRRPVRPGRHPDHGPGRHRFFAAAAPDARPAAAARAALARPRPGIRGERAALRAALPAGNAPSRRSRPPALARDDRRGRSRSPPPLLPGALRPPGDDGHGLAQHAPDRQRAHVAAQAHVRLPGLRSRRTGSTSSTRSWTASPGSPGPTASTTTSAS